MVGTLALVGGPAFAAGCTFDAGLLEIADTSEVLVLPTGAAYENPAGEIERAEAHFGELGASVRALDVLTRRDALEEDHAEAVASARFVYLTGGSPMHIKSVLVGSPVFEAVGRALGAGAVVAAADGGALVLSDPMVDPRGGAFTIGLGLVDGLVVVPGYNEWSDEATHRTRSMTPPGTVLAGVDPATALIRDADGSWRAEGSGAVVLFRDGHPATFDDLGDVVVG